MIMGDSGILRKANTEKEATNESTAREKIVIVIEELKTEKMSEGNVATIDNLKEYLSTKEEFKMKKESEVRAIVGTGGYAFRINEDLVIIETVDISLLSEIETTYIVNSVNGETMNVTITISNNVGIKRVIEPNGNEITLKDSGKTKLAIDYEITSGQDYVFKIQMNGESDSQDYILKADSNAKPIISENTSNTYPELTQYGVELNKKIEIDYGEGTDNYYSLDNGSTWNVYTGSIKVKNAGTIKAKTVTKNEITKIESKNYKMNLSNDAIGASAYDENEESYEQYNATLERYILIDESVRGSKIDIKCEFAWNVPTWIYFYNEQNEKVGEKQLYDYCESYFELGYIKYFNGVREVEIPNNAVKMILYTNKKSTNACAKIYEIMVQNYPIFNITGKYAKITSSGIEKPFTEISINYYVTSIKRQYRIGNDGEWKDYQEGDIIKLKIGETIEAKGIDINEKETKISSVKSNLKENGLNLNAYDEDESTYDGCEPSHSTVTYNRFTTIDESMWGKSIFIKCEFAWNIPTWVYFYNEQNEKVGQKQLYDYKNYYFELGYISYFNGVREVKIPENAVKMNIQYINRSTNSYFRIKEILLSN